MFRRFHRHARSFRVLDHLCLGRLGRSINTEGSGLSQALRNSIEAGNVLVTNFNLPIRLLIESLELFRSQWVWGRTIFWNGRG